jgi:hypothetical protein
MLKNIWWGSKNKDETRESKKGQKSKLASPPTKLGNVLRLSDRASTEDDDYDAEVSVAAAAETSQINSPGSKLFREQRPKVYRAVYSMKLHQPPLAAPAPVAAVAQAVAPPLDFTPRKHRVPLFQKEQQVDSQMLSMEQTLFLLRSHDVVDELTSVKEELGRVSAELVSLQADRDDLLARQRQDSTQATVAASLASQQQPQLLLTGPQQQQQLRWDTHKLLLRKPTHKFTLSTAEQCRLKEQRGTCLSVSLHNSQARQAFLTRCGSCVAQSHHNHHPADNSELDSTTINIIELSPRTCRNGGAATTIQHVVLLPSAKTNSNTNGFWISRDNGSHKTYGDLPERLVRRLHATKESMVYLATGPNGSYYAEFVSGGALWGSSDQDVCDIFSSWDVHRVAFGPHGSWIVLARDGRVSWKNIPARLQALLERRLASESALVEVSLGSAGSYCVRFLDGSTDYCLPAVVAQACLDLERRGSSITSMTLHPELSLDFCIRHTQ